MTDKGKKPPLLFLGNWKMNNSSEEAVAYANSFLQRLKPEYYSFCGIAPSYLSIESFKKTIDSYSKDHCNKRILLGAQNCHWLESGAHTGEVSPKMLRASGVDFAIIGHSERRQFYGETDQNVALRSQAVIRSDMQAIVCVGETKEEYLNNSGISVVTKQLLSAIEPLCKEDTKNLVIAYEPVWAIGTGLAATAEYAETVHSEIRTVLELKFGKTEGGAIKILYGGSVTPENIASLISQPNICGGLVGGASLKPDTFAELIEIALTVHRT
jgi:triosephosphate isomerase (TIM)